MSTDRSPTIHHADHCGSLLRPPELREARRLAALGRIGPDELRQTEDRAILDALKLQQAVGLTIFSDGEFRRKFWHVALATAFHGIEDAGPDFERFPLMRDADLADNPEIAAINPVVNGKLSAKGRIAAAEAAYLADHAPAAFKITLPSPAMITPKWLSGPKSRAAYPSFDLLVQDLANLLAAEARALADSGVTYIQLDAPGYTRFMIADRIAQMKRDGIDPERELASVIEAENTILRAAKRPGVTVAVHICHGTYFLDGRGAAGGPAVNYDPELTARLYHSLEADKFLVEYTDRGGGADSLRDAPKGKSFALGILNIRDPQPEAPDAVIRKIEAAARYVPIENLALCPNCGFSGAAAGAWMSADDQKRKLELLVRTADKLWA